MKNKKAQMKIQQTAFMLLALTLFFVLVGLFVLGFKLSDLQNNSELLNEQNAKQLVSKLANSPEFSCGNSFGNLQVDCVDLDKVMNLKKKGEEYASFWGVDDVKIRKTYPEMEGDVVCSVENYPDCNLVNVIRDDFVGSYLSNFVAICYKGSLEGYYQNKCEMGILMVSYEN